MHLTAVARRVVVLVGVATLLLSGLGVTPASAKGASAPTVISVTADTTVALPSSSGTASVQHSTGAGSGGATVTLTSSNPAVLAVPASVQVTQGASTSQFSYTTGAVSAPTAVTLSATLGASSASASLTVSPPALQSILAIPSEVEGGSADTLRPQLSAAAPSGGALVSLASSNPSLAPVPASVQIPAGSFGAPVSITTAVVSTVTTVTFTAGWKGVSVSGQLQIDPADTPTSVSLSPATTNGTNGSTGTVRLASPAPPNGTSIALQSSNPAVASVPSSTSVGFSGVAAAFSVTTTAVSTDTSVTISATAGGVTVSGTLTVVPTPPPAPALQSVTVSPGSVAGGSGATATAILNVAAPAGGAVVSLASSNTGAARVPASVTVPAGATSATFAITTASQNTTTTVAVGGSYGGASRASLFGVTSSRGGTVLPAPPSGVFIDPPWLDPTPRGQQNTNPQITWNGTLESFTLTVSSGQLPPGMTLISPFRPLTAVIQGTPTTQGTYAFVFKFTGASGTVFAWPYVWVIGPPAPLQIAQANFGPGTVGQAYDGGFFYGGGVAPYSWSISAGSLPPGLRFNSTTSEVTGTPTTRGTFSFTARLTDSTGTFLDTPETVTIS